tara:strand:+ start:2834 stop:4861 length:2028 start_codon:yes stop_codon:yes gene_type:complete
MEIRVYKDGEEKKLDLRGTSINSVLTVDKFTDVYAKASNGKIDIYVGDEKRFQGVDPSDIKDFSGTVIESNVSKAAFALNAVLSSNREVDSYVIGDDLSRKSTETVFTHNKAGTSGLGGRLRVDDDKAKLDITRSSGQGETSLTVEAETLSGADRGTITGKVAFSNGTQEAFTVQGGNPSLGSPHFTVKGRFIAEDGIYFGTGGGSALALTDLAEVPSSLGTSGQVLAVNSGGTALEFVAQSGGSGGGISDVVSDTTPQLGGDLDVNGNKIVSVSHGDITFDPDGGGNVIFRGNATQGSGRFILNCENNSHGITIKGPPHSAAASYTLTLPDDDGSSNQVLKTDGSGGLSWVDQTDTSLSDTNQTLSGARTVDMDGNYLYFKDSGTTKLQYDPNDSRFEFHGGLHVSGDFVTSVGGVAAGEVKFQEPSMGGTHGVVLKGPSTNLGSDVTFVLPDADGSTGQFLKTDGSGNLSFASAGGSGSTTFLGLTDTPSSFTASKFLKVNSAGNAVEFVDGGGSGISDVVEDTTPQLGGDLDTNSKNIVYAKTSTTDHSSNGEIVKIGTGSTTQGELCYYKSDGTWAAANASAESTSGGCLLGIALGTDPDVDGMLLRGMYTLDHSPGSLADELYVSTTAGDVTGNVSAYGQNNVVRVIGYCLDGSNGQIWFNPSNDFIVLA